MPVTNFVDASNFIVLTVCSGNVTRSELISGFTALKRHADFRPEFHQLIDLSYASQSDLDFKSLFDIQRTYDPFSKDGKRAIIAPNSASFGMARMYQSIVSGPKLQIFHSTLEATSWLGLEITVLEDALKAERSSRSRVRLGERRGKSSTA